MIHNRQFYSPNQTQAHLQLIQPVQHPFLVRLARATSVGQGLLSILAEKRLRYRLLWIAFVVGLLILSATHSWALFQPFASLLSLFFIGKAIGSEWSKMLKGVKA